MRYDTHVLIHLPLYIIWFFVHSEVSMGVVALYTTFLYAIRGGDNLWTGAKSVLAQRRRHRRIVRTQQTDLHGLGRQVVRGRGRRGAHTIVQRTQRRTAGGDALFVQCSIALYGVRFLEGRRMHERKAPKGTPWGNVWYNHHRKP